MRASCQEAVLFLKQGAGFPGRRAGPRSSRQCAIAVIRRVVPDMTMNIARSEALRPGSRVLRPLRTSTMMPPVAAGPRSRSGWGMKCHSGPRRSGQANPDGQERARSQSGSSESQPVAPDESHQARRAGRCAPRAARRRHDIYSSKEERDNDITNYYEKRNETEQKGE